MHNIIITYWQIPKTYFIDIFDSNTGRGIFAIKLGKNLIQENNPFINFREFRKKTIDKTEKINIILSIMSSNAVKRIFEVLINENIPKDLKEQLEILVKLPLVRRLDV